VIVSTGRKMALAESLALGAVRLTERFVASDPIGDDEVESLEREIELRTKRLARAVRAVGFTTAVGTSGTIAALAAMAAAMDGKAESPAGHRTLTRKALKSLVGTLLVSTAKERAKLPGLEEKRADIVTAGGVLLHRLMQDFGIKTLVVSDLSLREGIVLDALAREGTDARLDVDVRRESVESLARRTQVERAHADCVRTLALKLFDATHSLHQLASREREWLDHAALLHDAGVGIGYRRHHRHTQYLITHGGLKGFAAEEIAVIAQVARYHRKARPKESHEEFARLDPWLKPIVEKLAAILRVADGLDGTHRQVVAEVSASIRRRNVVLTVSASANPELEIWAARKKADLFARVFDRRLEIVPAAPWAPVEPPS
jgi:exopolyphosphatase / guanosine-5'-triphosphate,3'-diphosphate pyrophosphatase